MKRKNGRNHGEVFTSPQVVKYMLDECGYSSDKDLQHIRVLEPAAGAGGFAFEIVLRLFLSSQIFGFDFGTALHRNLVFVEQDRNAFGSLVSRLQELMNQCDLLDTDINQCCYCDDFLRRNFNQGFDLVIGNPPYIRHERLTDADKLWYRGEFATFKFRADLYIAFFERGLKLLKKDGLLSFICSNRWLTNQYGAALRELITAKYQLEQLLNIEKSSPFDEEVIAYPCIIRVLNARPSGKTFVYDTQENLTDFRNLPFVLRQTPIGADWHDLFLHYDLATAALKGIEQGFKIGIGVATGADEVFVLAPGADTDIEPERLLPIVRSKDIRHGKISWSGAKLVNPYNAQGLCDLSDYPGLSRYLEGYRLRLSQRHTARTNPLRWYKTIDRITPAIQKMAKILLPDFGGTEWLLVEEGNYYPHHNLYYITGGSLRDLQVLAALLVSDFVRGQLFHIGVRMNHGLPRLQAQTLRKLRIPDILAMTTFEYQRLLRAYQQQDKIELNDVVDQYCRRTGLPSANLQARQAV